MFKRLIAVSTLAALVAVTGASATESEAKPAQESTPSARVTGMWWWSECMLLLAYADAECGFHDESQACDEAIWAWEDACYAPLDDIAHC